MIWGGCADWATYGQDYELYTRAVLRTCLANLPNALLKFRRREDSVTAVNRREQIQFCCQAATALQRNVLGREADEQIARFLTWMHQESVELAIVEVPIKNIGSLRKYICNMYYKYKKKIL
jgi:iron-sulfur cluster repair protein YtfE (RIC family)